MIKVKKIFLTIALLLVVFMPISASAKIDEKTTLQDLKDELTRLQNKKKETENKKQMSESEKRSKNAAIANAYEEIEEAKQKVVEAKNKIEELDKKIEELNQESTELMRYFQQLNDNNVYVEFITDSSSMTELIMRMDAVKILISYNQDKLTEMEDLIKQNEQLQVDMKKYQNEEKEKITSYQNRIREIDSSIIQLSDIAMSIDDEIKSQKNLIKMYEGLGCKDKDLLVVCSSASNNSGWLKPVSKGIITSLFGYRKLTGQSSFHSGIDIGLKEGTAVYSATNGRVVNIINKSTCGGNQVYIQSNVKGVTYTILYAHLLTINVKLGDTVNINTIIGKSGGYSTSKSHGGYDRCTTGGHLHLSVSKTAYTSWSVFYANLMNPPGYPGKGVYFYSRYQWFD